MCLARHGPAAVCVDNSRASEVHFAAFRGVQPIWRVQQKAHYEICVDGGMIVKFSANKFENKAAKDSVAHTFSVFNVSDQGRACHAAV
ncbi:hypothetical protein Ddc_22475 [Ditylenchus destructor]|nr:hypothetical protein Ddc_22475 [Ditylenchus destructor]